MLDEFKNEGWISVHRKIMKNPFMKKPNYFSVWMFILLKANHTEKDFAINDRRVTIQRGSYLGSIQGISKHFGLPISSVHKIITCFKRERMVNTTVTRNYTIFHILNYDHYQSGEQLVNTARTAPETTNNDNNVNKPPIVPQGGQKLLTEKPHGKRKSKEQKVADAKLQGMLNAGYDPRAENQEHENLDVIGSDQSEL